MKRLLTLLALAGLTTAVACSEDTGGDKDKPIESKDAATDTGVDSGLGVAVRPTQVENPGAACSAASKTDCKGPAATCNETIMVGTNNIKLEGGYCSAQCNATAECGTGGCPAVEITAALPEGLVSLAGPALTSLIPSSCLDKCDKTDVCRSGYECKTIAELIPANLMAIAATFTNAPAFKVAYCLPPLNVTMPDAGMLPAVVDAGLRGLDGGVDGGL